MAQSCPKCKRANPGDATYCYFDGNVLSNGQGATGPVNPAMQPFPMPFVFPTGQSCNNFDQLALGCLNNWSVARDLVKEGALRTFLGGLGRADLALAVDEAARYPDKDRGLAQLLTKLPTQTMPKPILAVAPPRIDLGVMPVGQDKHLELRLTNQTLGLLFGSVQSDDNNWLALLNVPVGSNRKLFQFVDETVIPIMVRGQNLRAGNKPLEAQLTVESNGGTMTVVVTAQVPVTPFPDGVLAGAKTPRQIAEKAKANPKEAAVLFEKGAVGQWYKSNGWIYPVQGPAASGLAAVQQFFEALGLTPPPKVQISNTALSLQGPAGGALHSSLDVSTQEKRPIYASAVSDQAWLKPQRAQVRGRIVTIPLSVPVVPHCPGETLRAKLTVMSNGNQRFEVPVSLAVGGSTAAAATMPMLDMLDVVSAAGPTSNKAAWVQPVGVQAVPVLAAVQPVPVLAAATPMAVQPVWETMTKEPPRRTAARVAPAPAAIPLQPVSANSCLLPLLPIAFLMLAMMVTLGHDFVTWLWPGSNPAPIVNGNNVVDNTPRIALAFHDKELDITLGEGGVKPTGNVAGNTIKAFWEPSMRFGLTTVDASLKNAGQSKLLTREPDGTTNNTCLKVDNMELRFGDRPYRREDKVVTASWPGHWREMKKALPTDETGQMLEGWQSIWELENTHVVVTQTVEIVRGSQSNLFDTCLIRYTMTNEDTKKHNVGIRFMLDTYIGDNDGVPFLIPGETSLCDTQKDFKKPADVPDYIEASEFADLKEPGTIARLGLKLDGSEVPSRVTLGAWPNVELLRFSPDAHQMETMWNVPVLPMKSLTPHDSAVVIYWNPEVLEPGKSREVGFTYAQGRLSSGEGGGRLALSIGGSFAPGGEFTVTAYVSNPKPGEKVTLTLPAGFEFVSGDATQTVPAVPAGAASRNSPVTWKVRGAATAGDYKLTADSSSGETQTQPVRIKVQGMFGN